MRGSPWRLHTLLAETERPATTPHGSQSRAKARSESHVEYLLSTITEIRADMRCQRQRADTENRMSADRIDAVKQILSGRIDAKCEILSARIDGLRPF